MAASPRRRGLVARLALVLLGFVLLLETVPRFLPIPGLRSEELAPEYVAKSPDLAFGPHPYTVIVPLEGSFDRPAANKQVSHGPGGFRGAPVPLAKPAGTFRIACVGGSSTYGTGPSSDAATWPAQLVVELERRFPGRSFDVVNAGAPGWTTFESLAGLAFRVLPYEPDLVVVHHATNDVKAALWPGAVPDNTHFRTSWPVFRPSPLEPLLERSVAYLVWRRYATDYVSQRADLAFYGIKNWDPSWRPPYGDGPLPDQGFVNFQRNVTSIVETARAHGSRVALVTQHLWSRDPESDHPMHGASVVAGQARANDLVRGIAAERDVPLVDMDRFMGERVAEQVAEGGEQRLFRNNVHMTDAGAALFARRLAEELVREGVLD